MPIPGWCRFSSPGIGSPFVHDPLSHLFCSLCRATAPIPSVGCGGSAAEGINRACASFPRLLRPSLCHSQGHRWVEPGDRPLAPQQLSGRLRFPHRDYPVCSPISPSRRLDGIPGSPGCLPPGSGPSVFTTLPEVLRGRVGLPVPCPLLRPVNGSTGVHARHVPGLFDNASSRFPDSLVPR